MRRPIILSFIFCLSLAAACSKDQEGRLFSGNQDDSREIHFIQSSIEKEFERDSAEGIIQVDIARPGCKGEYSVWLSAFGDDAACFSLPGKVTLEDGSYSTTIPVKVDLGSLMMGSSLKTTVYITGRESEPGNEGAYISRYSDKLHLSVSYSLQWETVYRTTDDGEQVPLTATFHYNGFYTGDDPGLPVEKAVDANVYRIGNWASGVPFQFLINDDNSCTVPAQSIGYFHSTYNEYVYVSDMAVYTGNPGAYASYPCTFDGTGHFEFYLIYYVSAGYFTQGTETMDYDLDLRGMPEVAIRFDGIETTETGFRAPRVTFTKNSYTQFFKAAIIAGNITGDKAALLNVRNDLIDDSQPGVTGTITSYQDYSGLWNLQDGNYTAVALAYDEDGRPGELSCLRFTCDVSGVLAPSVNVFEWYCPADNPLYDGYTTCLWSFQADNVASLKYLCMRKDYLDYLMRYGRMSLSEITAQRGNLVNETAIDLVTGEGLETSFTTLQEGRTYTLSILVYNEYGDSLHVYKDATTAGHYASDYDRTKTLDDFLGAFRATASVYNSAQGATSSEVFRLDVYQQDGNNLVINGLPNLRNFAPQVQAYYDEDLHMVIVEPQDAGMYRNNYARLGFSDGLSIYWGGSVSMAIGYIGDTLYWTASPYSSAAVSSLEFLLFSSPETNSSTYLRESAGSRSLSAVTMTRLDY